MWRRLTRLTLSAALAANLACNRSEDCKCAGPEYSLGVFPDADTIDVPTNTHIWGTSVTGLLDDTGVTVPVTRSNITDNEDSSSLALLGRPRWARGAASTPDYRLA